MAHPEIGHRILMRLIGDLADVAIPETQPRMEGNQMHTILTAKKGAKVNKPAPAPGAARPAEAEVETK
jgi:translation initiation factor IF-3